MVTSHRWVVRAFARSSFLRCALLTALVAGCHNRPINPFLARENPSYEEDAENPNRAIEDPLNESLARLKDRGQQFRDAAATASDAADALHEDARGLAKDSVGEARRALATSLDAAEQQGKQLADNAVVAASATARQVGNDAQLRAIESLEDLPLDQAGPVLLITMAQGTPVAQRAAAEQLSRRWPAAAGMPADLDVERHVEAVAQLRQQWVDQYGQIDEAVAAARAEAARTIDQAGQIVDDATGVVQAASQQIRDVQKLVAAYREADLPATARLELAQSIERMSTDADAQVRIKTAKAMGELADPVFLPALMAMLNDQPQVQTATLDSLARVAGTDVAIRADGKPISNEEKVRVWQLWYREQQDAAAAQ